MNKKELLNKLFGRGSRPRIIEKTITPKSANLEKSYAPSKYFNNEEDLIEYLKNKNQ